MTQQLLPFRPARPNLLIEAGAGTGKTTEIVKEALELLLEHPDLEPERLVMITFTEKAAAEIGERLRDAMTDLHTSFDRGGARWPSDAERPIFEVPSEKMARYRAACAKHLEKLDKIRSQTIHSFCQSILRMFPLEGRIDPNFRLIEGYERSRLLQEVYAAWLEHETVTHATEEWLDDWQRVLEHFAGVDRVQDRILVDLLQRRVLVTDDRYELGDFSDAEESIRAAIAEARQLSRALIESLPDDASRSVLSHLHDASPPATGSTAEWREYFAPIAQALDEVNLRGAPDSVKGPLKALRREANSPSVFDLLARHEAAVALRRLARRFIAHLDQEKRKRGVLDFDDLLLDTAELLENSPAAQAVRAKFDYIFVDEFQDTDRVQARIIDRLARNKSGELVHGRVILVGDPKQSIYAFRHADPETYRDTLERFETGGARTRVLSRQYRSEPELVRSLNAIFRALFSVPSEPNVYRPGYHELEAARGASGAPGPHIAFLRAESVPEDNEATAAEHEARAIASYILSQHRLGRCWRDFAILLRKMGNAQAFLDVFDRCGLPYVLPPIGALLETRPVVDLLAVLRAIAAPYDLGARVSAARTPYFALDDDEIVAGALAERAAHPPPPVYTQFQAKLHRYRELSGRLPVADLINRILDECQIELVYGLARNGSEWLRFLERFREIATQFDLSFGGSLAQFVDELLRRREGAEELQPTPIDDGRDAVRIMTVHGAKGLEFPVVILPELCTRTKEDTLSVFAIEDPARLVFTGEVATIGSRYLRLANGKTPNEICTDRKEAESDRLFYVAVTRARDDVVFVCSPERLVKTSFWKRIAALFGWDRGVPAVWSADPGVVIDSVAVGDGEIPVAFITPEPLASEGAAHRFIDARTEERISKAVVCSDEPLPAAETPRSRGQIRQRAAAAKNRRAGILLHRLLELWDGDPAAVEPLLKKLAGEQGADARTLEMTRKRVATLSRSATFQRVASSTTHGRELTIHYLDEVGSAVEGRIDRLIEEEGRLVVIDFKSGQASETRTSEDRDQVQRYCGAIARMSGKPCQGLLWYIDLDSDEAIEVQPA